MTMGVSRIASAVALLVWMALCLSAPARAQFRSLANPSWELNDPAGPGAPNYEIITDGSVVGWDSTTGEIELWDTNFNGVPAYTGNVFAEMNANVNGTLYQNICLVNGEPIGWTFAHRARDGGPATQTARFQIANSSGTVLQTLATQNSTTANQIWNVNSGSVTYTGASGFQRVQFTTTNTGSYGNFLDGIQLTLRPFIQLSMASGSGAESIASANLPTLRISGTVTSTITVNITITGGTATRGTDYTTPGGGAAFTVSVPAGIYYDSAIPLGITVNADSTVETNETIAMSLSAGTGYTIGHSTTCGSAAQTTSTYTITNDDSRVTLRKQWSGAVVGDDATVTISRSAVVIDSLVSDAGTANQLDTDASPTVAVIGETLTFAETLSMTNTGAYSPSLACTGVADANLADGLTIGATETAIVCTYTNTYTTPLAISKSSSTLSDGISGVNPRSIPGATIRYCILVSNAGWATSSSVNVADALPANLTFVSGSIRSGTTCAGATTVEDDDDSGVDESDPFGVSFAGSTLTAVAASLTSGSSFAVAFTMLIN